MDSPYSQGMNERTLCGAYMDADDGPDRHHDERADHRCSRSKGNAEGNVSAAAEQQRRDGTATAKARRKEHRGNAVAKQTRDCCSGANGFATEVALASVRLEVQWEGLRLLSHRVVR